MPSSPDVTARHTPRRARKARKPGKRGPPLRTQAGNYTPLLTFFEAFPSFNRDCSQTPEHGFRLLQVQQGWEAGSTTYNAMRRKFLTDLVAETRSPVHAFFAAHQSFLEYDSTASPHLEFLRLARLNTYPVNRVAFNAAFIAEFNGPLDSFFLQYPEFQYNPRGTHMAEFRRLVTAKAWDAERAKQPKHAEEPESIAYNTARDDFFDAFRGEFDHLFGSDAESFNTWQKLCETLGVEPMPDNVTQCKKVTRPLMVNIYDITHHKRTGAPFDFFNTLRDLRSYTIEGGLFFPKKRAKESALKFLLREIFPKVKAGLRRVLR